MSDVAWHLNGAKAEMESAHAAALKEDKGFAHEVAQILFAVGCIGEAWTVRQNTKVRMQNSEVKPA